MSNYAERFHQLHHTSMPLCLPNAWDAGSARLFETLGAKAIATTSAGMAWSLGYQDIRRIPFTEISNAASRIARVLNVPLSVDIENGYSDNPRIVAENVMHLANIGVVGINIEDGDDDPFLLASKINAIRETLARNNFKVFINARCDVYLAKLAEESKLLAASLARYEIYANAGADGFFLPGVVKEQDIKTITDTTRLPLNVLVRPELPDAEKLTRLGVHRISAGSSIAQAVLGYAKGLADDFLQNGEFKAFSKSPYPYSEIQALFGS